jgi:hypothetical protein
MAEMGRTIAPREAACKSWEIEAEVRRGSGGEEGDWIEAVTMLASLFTSTSLNS